MTKSDPYHNEYECPVDECGEWISVPLPLSDYVTCPYCKTKLEIDVDADWHDGHWHDLTTISVVESEELEHMRRMLKHGLDWFHDKEIS